MAVVSWEKDDVPLLLNAFDQPRCLPLPPSSPMLCLPLAELFQRVKNVPGVVFFYISFTRFLSQGNRTRQVSTQGESRTVGR